MGAYFVDRFDAGTLALVVGLLGLTIADGVLTIELIDLNSEEVNPIMAHLLDRGVFAFLMGKYLLTATGLPFLVVYQKYPLFCSRFRVGWLLPLFVALYLVLLFHQWTLLRSGRPAREPRRTGLVSSHRADERAECPGSSRIPPRTRSLDQDEPLITPCWGSIFAILGSCLGSFLNVCAYRDPRPHERPSSPVALPTIAP